jgi:hypothetical protein
MADQGACICSAGFEDLQGVCARCPPGKYKNTVGKGLCELTCPFGSTSDLGAQSIEDCFCEAGRPRCQKRAGTRLGHVVQVRSAWGGFGIACTRRKCPHRCVASREGCGRWATSAASAQRLRRHASRADPVPSRTGPARPSAVFAPPARGSQRRAPPQLMNASRASRAHSGQQMDALRAPQEHTAVRLGL